jgi:hypothetical protein
MQHNNTKNVTKFECFGPAVPGALSIISRRWTHNYRVICAMVWGSANRSEKRLRSFPKVGRVWATKSKNGNNSRICFFKLKTGLQNTVRSRPPPQNPGLWRSHLLDLPKNPGLWRSHLLDLFKNPGLWRSHLWSPGRPGPRTGTLPGGLTCAKW